MIREQCKESQKAFNHFASGGSLWYYEGNNKWVNQTRFIPNSIWHVQNIIEDKHFEARKAFALGEEIGIIDDDGSWRYLEPKDISWNLHYTYRPKPKEVYKWQWLYTPTADDGLYYLTPKHYVRKPSGNYTRFEPSKRIKND